MPTFVVGYESSTASLCKAVLGYKTIIDDDISTVVTTSEDGAYPIELAYDYKSNTEYSPALTSGEVTITLTQATSSDVSYFGLLSKNAADCELAIEVEVWDLGNEEWVSVGTRSSFANGKPQMIFFDPILSNEQKITLTFTSKCYITSMAMGEAIVFSRTASLGYQPARNASLDEVMNFTTDGNNFIQGRRISNGFEEVANIRYQSYSGVDSWWDSFMNHVLDSKPLFFMGNDKVQANCVYGLQVADQLPKPSYTTAMHTDIKLTIRGFA